MYFNSFYVSEDMLFETITPELLRTDKMFLKLLRKQQRELEMLKKKHGKEKSMILKQHCTVIDHMMASHDRDKQGHERTLEKAIKKKGCVKCWHHLTVKAMILFKKYDTFQSLYSCLMRKLSWIIPVHFVRLTVPMTWVNVTTIIHPCVILNMRLSA